MTRSALGRRRGSYRLPLVADRFNRANSTTNLGSTDGFGSLDPMAWVQQQGTWGIINNNAYTSVALNRSIATLALGVSDIEIEMELPSINALGILFRFVDLSNYWYFIIAGSQTELHKFVAGVDTAVSVVGGGSNTLRVIAKGSSIKCYGSNGLRTNITDSDLLTANKHGMWNGPYTLDRYDNFAAYTP